MQQQIRPIPTMEAAATTWGVAGLVGFAAFGALFMVGDWTFLQAVFGGAVVLGALGLLLQLTVGKIVPPDAKAHRPATRQVSDPDPVLVVDLEAMRPRDLNKPSPHKAGIDDSMISDTEAGRGLNGPTFRQPIRGTVEAAPATRLPSPAPINATDPGVARPVGATADPKPMTQPAPLHGRIISPEPPQPFDGTSPGTVSRNEAALAGGAPVTVRATATHSAQSYNEPGRGDDTVVATGGTIPDSSPASEGSARSDAVDGGSADTLATPMAGESDGVKPATLDGPRVASGDDLKKIKGVGPKLEQTLNDMGFWHFDQIAAWTEREVAWVDQNLEGFKGRVTRDDWVPQAKELAGGGETAFSERVDKGDVYE